MPHRFSTVAGAALLAVAVAACGFGGEETLEETLGQMRRQSGPPLYWVGESFDGLPLTRAESVAPGRGFVAYGTCEPRGGFPDGGGCAVPVQIQQFPFTDVPWPIVSGCARLSPIRGVPVAHHDGFLLFTGATIVKIYADNWVTVAERLRPINRPGKPGAPLPAPRRAYLARINAACGTHPGDRGPDDSAPGRSSNSRTGPVARNREGG